MKKISKIASNVIIVITLLLLILITYNSLMYTDMSKYLNSLVKYPEYFYLLLLFIKI